MPHLLDKGARPKTVTSPERFQDFAEYFLEVKISTAGMYLRK